MIPPSLKLSTLKLLVCSLLGLALTSTLVPCQAKLLDNSKKKAEQEAVEKVRTYQPPPAEALTTNCEPYRAEAVTLYKKPFFIRPFYEPRRLWLVHKHQQCRHELMSQEYTYLKHADIEQPPSLPKLIPATKTGAPNGNLP